MKIAIGSDHGGYKLKEDIKAFLIQEKIEVNDFGTNSIDSVDYPDYGLKVSLSVSAKEADFGIVICTTGIGMCIVANKVKGIRCALVNNIDAAMLTREHNDANVLALGAKYTTKEMAIEIVKIFIYTSFLSGRHQRRVEKINKFDKGE